MSRILAAELRKSYGPLVAVDGVSFEIASGEAFGLLGPNGAGKTTTISMLVGLLSPDEGTVRIDDRDPLDANARRCVGVAPQSLSVYEELTARENLEFFGGLYGLLGAELKERVDWALDFSGLADRSRDRVSKYSGGMKRRLNIAVALIHQPSVLLLDEPTVGVDPQSRNHIFESILNLKAQGLTVIYTTHYMEEVQRLCDRVAIMDRGKILALDTVEGLLSQFGGSSVVEGELDGEFADNQLPGRLDGRNYRWETSEPLKAIAMLSSRGVKFQTLQVKRPDLESVFLSLTGRSLRDQ